jgi:polyribonucleotide nucleotidyltransferase
MQLGGRELVIESGKYAEQADGSVIVRCGDTAVMVNATASKAPRDGIDFFPLSIEFEEKLYSVGKIPGGFIKREGRPSEKAILASRLIDRPLRPLFPKGYYNDVQVIATVMSVDTDIPPEVYAMIGSSAALSISGLPFMGPTGSVVVGLVDGEYIINPNSEQREKSRMHLTVSGTKDAIMMVEAGAKEVTEQEMLNGILFAHEEIKKICDFIQGIKDEIGKPAKEVEIYHAPEEIDAAVREYAKDKVVWSVDTFDRKEREQRQSEITEDIQAHFAEQFPEHAKDIDAVIYNMTKETVREKIKHGIRPDGRKLNEVRPIWCETGLFARTHGSAVFTRGQTQVMTIVTLGAIGDGQTLDGISDQDFKRYMHHYNMPPYSTGEAKALRSSNRREIGHGALAERAIEPMLPSEEEFPYAIRTVSETFESNGSTSMASTCASCMSLMAAGVPIKKMVAGISCGLVTGATDDDYILLTDIQGLEDFFGDMDFKVTGTDAGITAIQMDIKIHGLTRPIVEGAIARCREARMYIMENCMKKAISEPRPEVSKYAPKIIQIQIDPTKIGDVVGQRGKTINAIIEQTGVKIDITDDGSVSVCGTEIDKMNEAIRLINIIVSDFEAGQVLEGKVVSIKEFGAFLEFAPGKEAMVHISKIAKERIDRVEDVLTLGDKVKAVCLGKDKMGRVSFSIKDVK